jgi:hypothetical protein
MKATEIQVEKLSKKLRVIGFNYTKETVHVLRLWDYFCQQYDSYFVMHL